MPSIEESWYRELEGEFSKDYMRSLREFLLKEKQQYRVFPPASKMFEAFNLCPFDKLKVVILGQDPYHGYGQAEGLCFSVPSGIAFPPSLRNIFREYSSDLDYEIPFSGSLRKWAEEGVFLLNTCLSVRESTPLSHANMGWETFTDAAIRAVAEKKNNIVFILWGSHAIAKSAFIDPQRHLIIKAPHPSPLSAHRGFFGGKYFSRCNTYLQEHSIGEIDWKL